MSAQQARMFVDNKLKPRLFAPSRSAMARCVAAAELGCTIEEKRILAGQTVPERSAQIGKSLLSLWQSRIEIRWGLSCRCHAACTSVPTNILFSAVSRQAPLAARSI